ncbi:hypothetical protein GL981_11690 (plasmid) [Spiroplasma citri]|nr:hypothetical protein GL981_11690 [Spiroplasma citri]
MVRSWIKWLCSQTDIEHCQTERELKMENGNLNAYPDLIITKNDDIEIYVEFERTQTLANWIQLQIDKDDFKTELQQVIIWPTQELNT